MKVPPYGRNVVDRRVRQRVGTREFWSLGEARDVTQAVKASR